MKSLKEIREELVREGAVVRLGEVNREREILLKIISLPSTKANGIVKAAREIKKDSKSKKKHWTQTPRGRKIMRKRMVEMHKNGKL